MTMCQGQSLGPVTDETVVDEGESRSSGNQPTPSPPSRTSR